VKFDPLAVDVFQLLNALGITDARHEGDRWVARCPSGNHADVKPSWDIKDDVGHEKHATHHCFSCGFGGTATDLVCDLKGITPNGAREWLVERAMGAPPIPRRTRAFSHRDEEFVLPEEVVIAPFEEWPTQARMYVTEERGIDHEVFKRQVKRWGLGYATEGDLHGRIVIPVRDFEGQLVTYTARTYIDHPKRYREPKKIEGARKGAVLGEQHWPPPEHRDYVTVTEGGFNALAVERVAPTMPVASLFGSSVDIAQVDKLATFKRVLLLTDEDMAGDRAADIIERALKRHVARLEYVELERGQDADSAGPKALRAALVTAWRKVCGRILP
jgi:DNA primase